MNDRLRVIATAALALATQGIPVAASAQNASLVAREAVPATVTILVFGSLGDTLAQGSGFIVRADGVIVTNWHVLIGAASAEVKLPSGKDFRRVMYLDGDSAGDIALIKVPGHHLPTIPTRASIPSIGDHVVVIGTPLGLSHTVSEGIVSATRIEAGRDVVQISAPISPGSSGGPVLDETGHVFAIAAASVTTGQQLNFAVPVRYALGLLDAGTAPRELSAVFAAGAARTVNPIADRVASTVLGFLAAANRGDIGTMSRLWGSADKGPAATYMSRHELLRRLTVISMYLRHDSVTVTQEDDSAMSAEAVLVRAGVSVAVPFALDRTPDGDVLISSIDLVPAQAIWNLPVKPPPPTHAPERSLTGSYRLVGDLRDADGTTSGFRLGTLHLGHEIGLLTLLPSYRDSAGTSQVFFVSSARTNRRGQVTIDVGGMVLDGFQTDSGLHVEAVLPNASQGSQVFTLDASRFVLPLSSVDGLYAVQARTTYYARDGHPSATAYRWSGDLALTTANDSIWADMVLVNQEGGSVNLSTSAHFSDSDLDLTSADSTRVLKGSLRAGRFVGTWIDHRGGARFQGSIEAQRF